MAQSGQNPRLPQAFQEIGSELTMTILVSEEKSSLRRAFPSGDLIGSGVLRVHGVAKPSVFMALQGFEESELWLPSSWWGTLTP